MNTKGETMMDATRETLDELRARLDARGDPERSTVAERLAPIWDDLDGDDAGMAGHKLVRIFALKWEPPTISFSIERHGALVAGGSGYVEIQRWKVDLTTGRKLVSNSRKRRWRPMAPKFETAPIAQELAEKIVAHEDDPRLRWSTTGDVQVRMAEVLPRGPKQTTEGRRKRLNRDLESALERHGWKRQGAWWSGSSPGS